MTKTRRKLMPLIIENQEWYNKIPYYWPNDITEQINQYSKQWYNQILLCLLPESMTQSKSAKENQKLLHLSRQGLTSFGKLIICTLTEKENLLMCFLLFLGLMLF